MLDKKITHSIYLIKSEFSENDDFLQNIDGCHHYSIPISGHQNAEVYLKTIRSKIHSWSRLLPTEDSGIDWSQYRTRSLFGILLIKVEDRLFAITSGFGRFLLHPFSFENRFGFRAVLNSIEPQTIQQLSKMTLSQNPKISIEQVARGVNLGQFGIDGFLDLVQRVKGKSKIENLGLSLDGEDALKISVAYELDQLPDLLTECLSLYNSDEYQTYFPEVDNLAEVKDKEQKSFLNTEFEKQLNSELDHYLAGDELSGDIWASIPDIVFDDDFDCFTCKKDENALRYYDIELNILFRERYRKKDGSKKRNVSISTLSNDQIFIKKADGTFYEKWRAINCINAIIEMADEKYFFIEGKWFRASSSYIDTLDQKINGIPSSNLNFADWPQHVHERDYLLTNPLNHSSNYLILDRDNIYIDGQSPIEPCDIYTQDKLLIHLKRYGSSALLGHLFNQGYVSGDLLINSVEFRTKFNEKLADGFTIEDVNPSEYTISYVVGTKYPDNFNLPLFSKITLTKSYDELIKKGFNVTLDLCNMTLA